MTEALLSACRFRCDLLPGLLFQRLEKGGFGECLRRLERALRHRWGVPRQIICNGCREVSPAGELPARECVTGGCVEDRVLPNCGHGEEYPCARRDGFMRAAQVNTRGAEGFPASHVPGGP